MTDATEPPQDLPDEHWLPVAGYERLYWISDQGRVWSTAHPRCRGRLISIWPAGRTGSPSVTLYRGEQKTSRSTRALVRAAFGDGGPPCVPGEEWRTVAGWDAYSVSNLGQIWSSPRATSHGGLIRANADRDGHLYVRLSQNGSDATKRVHALVAIAFLGSRPSGQQVRHLDGNPAHNNVLNLAWGTASENALDRVRHGRHYNAVKTHCPSGHPYSDIRNKWNARLCKTCRRERAS